jgi:hypothetical protein
VKQHLGRQSGVQTVEVSLLDGKVDVTPKEDGHIDPAQLLKATYDSGVTAAEMDMTARGKIVQGSSGSLALQVAPNQSTQAMVTVRGQLYKKPAGKKKPNPSTPLTLLILEVQKKE